MQILTAALLILIGVLLFGFIIFFHELGHFLLAKASGIRVNEFALGMGPKLFGFRKGETQYSLRLLPIGGYCAMEGEDEDSGDPRAFGNKPVWKRFLVVAAGSVFNIVLGFFLMMIVLGQQDVFTTTQIASFTEDSALQAAGAQVGDTIVEVDGYAIYTDRDLNFALVLADPAAVSMVVERDGQRVDLGTFALHSQTLEDGSSMVSLDFYVEPEAVTFLSLVRRSATDTLSMARMVVETLKGMFTGRFGLNDVAGPIGTAQAIGQARQRRLVGKLWPGGAQHPADDRDDHRQPGGYQSAAPARPRRRKAAVPPLGGRHPPPRPRQIRGLCPRGGFCPVYRADSGHRLSRYFPHCPRIANKPGGPAAGPPFLKDRERGTVCNGEVQNK